jgi:hypothetical protein
MILKVFSIDELTGTPELTQATILLFFFFGTSTAGLTYCLTYLFKSASTAQNAVIFFNVSVAVRVLVLTVSILMFDVLSALFTGILHDSRYGIVHYGTYSCNMRS